MAVKIAGVDMGRISLPQALTIPAGATSQTDFDVQTDLITALSQMGGLRSVGLTSPIPYDLDGQVAVTAANLTFPWRKQGSFTIQDLGQRALGLISLF